MAIAYVSTLVTFTAGRTSFHSETQLIAYYPLPLSILFRILPSMDEGKRKKKSSSWETSGIQGLHHGLIRKMLYSTSVLRCTPIVDQGLRASVNASKMGIRKRRTGLGSSQSLPPTWFSKILGVYPKFNLSSPPSTLGNFHRRNGTNTPTLWILREQVYDIKFYLYTWTNLPIPPFCLGPNWRITNFADPLNHLFIGRICYPYGFPSP
jgi:hypothetical protein